MSRGALGIAVNSKLGELRLLEKKKHVNKYIILSMLLNFCVYNILNMFLA